MSKKEVSKTARQATTAGRAKTAEEQETKHFYVTNRLDVSEGGVEFDIAINPKIQVLGAPEFHVISDLKTGRTDCGMRHVGYVIADREQFGRLPVCEPCKVQGSIQGLMK
jgi:hypothetical protein